MAKKLVIPWELKYDYAIRSSSSLQTGLLYAIREKFGAETALEIYERAMKMDDRVKNLTNTLLTIFKLEGNDVETIAKWWDIYGTLCGHEASWLERSETIARGKITKCIWKTEPKDLSDKCIIISGMINQALNLKATNERLKGMCAGDPYCEYVTKIEE